MIRFPLIVAILLPALATAGEDLHIPSSYRSLEFDSGGSVVLIDSSGERIASESPKHHLTLQNVRGGIAPSDSGITFSFEDTSFNGSICFGLLNNPDEAKFSYPVFGGRATIKDGSAVLNLRDELSAMHDFTDWEGTGIMRLGYRIIDDKGNLGYDGKLVVRPGAQFVVDTCIIEGPFVNLLNSSGAVISFETNFPIAASVSSGGHPFIDKTPATHHEIPISGLAPDSEQAYTVICGDLSESHTVRTAPLPGSRRPFTFAYASDGRANYGGGERNLYGTNAYMLKRIGVACVQKQARFLQYTGDLISGYETRRDDLETEYSNWKRAAEPFAQYVPFIAGIGNHECLVYRFRLKDGSVRIDRFPFNTSSSEAVFAANFVNPTNGPQSEDGSALDPNPGTTDFPPYAETVFFYTYDNVAMVVMNSEYWFSSSISWYPATGGNPHGYLMDNQLDWLQQVLADLEADSNIDHVFLTFHAPIFPGGGHVSDCMWYNGDNSVRARAGGVEAARGIIEQRDRLLDLIANRSSKVIAVLVGDEHNYCVTHVTPDMAIYPANWTGDRLKLRRSFWQITNGAAGAPYYGPEKTIWQDHVVKFTTQNALVLVHVDGSRVSLETINPDTMELLHRLDLTE